MNGWPTVRGCSCQSCQRARRRGNFAPRYPTSAQHDLIENWRLHPAIKGTIYDALIDYHQRRGMREHDAARLLELLERHVRRFERALAAGRAP